VTTPSDGGANERPARDADDSGAAADSGDRSDSSARSASDSEAEQPRHDTGDGPAQRPGPAPTHVLHYVARSDRGLIRATNQDSVFAGDRLLVIADGMGGHAAGDTASRLVVGAFAPLNDRAPASDLLSDLLAATREGNDAIAEMVAENPELDGMGTTVTAMLFDGGRVGMAHVGDSRAYLYRSGVLHQLTHDDTFVQSLVDDGRITEGEAAHHPQRNLLLRALNGTDLDPALALREVRAGDRYLLCSDGLSGVVDAEHIADTLADPDPERAADVLIQRALLRGGPDNVTVIVADVVDTGVVPVPGPVTVASDGDPDATGPIGQLTREMPRVPLPPIPEVPGARAEVLPSGDENDFDEDDFDGGDEEFDDGDFDRDGSDDDEGGDEHSDGGHGPRSGGHSGEDSEGDDAADGARVPVAAGRGPGGSRRGEQVRWHRRGALAVAIVALIGVALGGSTLWVRSQYNVGAANGLVGVYRGVNGSLLGVRFSSFQEDSCHSGGDDCRPLRLADLQPAARNLVQAGIEASSLSDARNVMNRLTQEMLPVCPNPTASPSSSATTASGAGSSSGSAGSSAPDAASTTAPTTTTAPSSPPPTTATTTPAAGKTTAAAGNRTATTGGTAATKTGTENAAAKAGTTTAPAGKAALTTIRTGTPSSLLDATAHPLGHRLATQAAPDHRGTITVEPVPTTMTVRTTVARSGSGLYGAAIGAAQAPSTTGSTGTGASAGTGEASSGAGAGSTTVTAATPTITVTQTVTTGPTVTATPLAPAPAVPGVTCRTVG
jgi:protein phosphatase